MTYERDNLSLIVSVSVRHLGPVPRVTKFTKLVHILVDIGELCELCDTWHLTGYVTMMRVCEPEE